jgi:hypothetical protein
VWQRWSFSYPSADFGAAAVSLRFQKSGTAIAVTTERVANGFGDNTLMWRVGGSRYPTEYATWPKPPADQAVLVNITNVVVAGRRRSFAYTVKIMDPAV